MEVADIVQIIGCGQNSGCWLEWDEENRLRFVLGEKFARYYGYDGNGERVYKITGVSSIDQVYFGYAQARAIFDDAVLYPNPYIVITPRGYTKHYYAGSERLATVIGGGGFDSDSTIVTIHTNSLRYKNLQDTLALHYQQTDPFRQNKIISQPLVTTNINNEQEDKIQYQCKPIELGIVDVSLARNILLQSIDNFRSVQNLESDIYYYHSDHLQSAHWITDSHGMPIQYLHYAPFGELLANQTIAGYNERYKFTGKERDTETGYDYFGARYYSSSLYLWLSVDPLADKYPNISPYAYCNWNPINRLDPDGMDDEQRQLGIEMAREYVRQNPNTSPTKYKIGAKGYPGQEVDCSGLVSNCAIAGGEKDPNNGKYNGVRNIADNTQKIEDMNDIEVGNFVTFNTGGKNGDYSHIGIISDVARDDNGNVVDFQFIHSSSSKGPIQTNYKSMYWDGKATGFYKWDTKPDIYQGLTLPQITVLGNKPKGQNPIVTFQITPISVNFNSNIIRR